MRWWSSAPKRSTCIRAAPLWPWPRPPRTATLAVDPRALADQPLLEEAMRGAGFELDPHGRQPGAWLNADDIPVDLMVPEALAGPGGRRSARVPPHANQAMRRATGLEATIVDHHSMQVAAAGRAEEGIGDPDVVSASVAALSQDVLSAVHEGDRLGDGEHEEAY